MSNFNDLLAWYNSEMTTDTLDSTSGKFYKLYRNSDHNELKLLHVLQLLDFNFYTSPLDNHAYSFQKLLNNDEYSLHDFLCSTNDHVSVNIRLHEYQVRSDVYRSIDVYICHANKEDMWVDLKVYGLSIDSFISNYTTIVDKLIRAWKAMYV